jgi:sugar/nucleoside kinase (ribokinase family)
MFMPQIVILGEALIDVFAEKGVPLHAAKTLHPSPGGAPANVAVALARLGADVGFIGKVGVDDYGSFLIDLLTGEGVDTTHFVADPHGPTMLAVVAVPSPTEQQFILYNGANTLLDPEELSQMYIASANVFGYGSVTLAGESRAAALQAAQWAREVDKHVIFDVNLRPLLWPSLDIARKRIEEALDTTTIVKLNEIELEFLTGLSDPARGSQRLVEAGIHLCCVSLGADGAYFNNGAAQGLVPGFVVEVQDTTGSGDAFVAGLSYRVNNLSKPVTELDESTLCQIISFANACGAAAATQVGAMSASPTLEAVEQMLQNT